MTVTWGIMVDCADPARLAAFWREALGYVDAPVPDGFASWEEWLIRWEVPPEEWNDGGRSQVGPPATRLLQVLTCLPRARI